MYLSWHCPLKLIRNYRDIVPLKIPTRVTGMARLGTKRWRIIPGAAEKPGGWGREEGDGGEAVGLGMGGRGGGGRAGGGGGGGDREWKTWGNFWPKSLGGPFLIGNGSNIHISSFLLRSAFRPGFFLSLIKKSYRKRGIFSILVHCVHLNP